MSTWRMTRETSVSRAAPARRGVSRGRDGAPESPGTSREIFRTTSRWSRARAPGSWAPVGLHRLIERAPEGLNLGLECVDAVEHLLDRLGQGIGQIRVFEIEAGRDLPAITVDHLTGHADHDRVRRHLGHHDRAGADAGAFSHPDRTDHRCAGSHDNVALERRMALLTLQAGAAERHALVEG